MVEVTCLSDVFGGHKLSLEKMNTQYKVSPSINTLAEP